MTNTKKMAQPVLPDAVLVEMLLAVPPVAPPPERAVAIKQELLAQIRQHGQQVPAAGSADAMRIVRADNGNWISFANQVAMKVLHDDGETRSWLARFQPGGRIPAHWQSGDEEAIVLDGWCQVGEAVLQKGDYQMVPKGSLHGEITSPGGCLIFVRSHSAKRSAAELAASR